MVPPEFSNRTKRNGFRYGFFGLEPIETEPPPALSYTAPISTSTPAPTPTTTPIPTPSPSPAQVPGEILEATMTAKRQKFLNRHWILKFRWFSTKKNNKETYSIILM